jgi:cyclic beta-1,2-glucan synthetase
MKDETILIHAAPAEAPELNLRRLREAGLELGLEPWEIRPRSVAKMPRINRRSGLRDVAARAVTASESESQKENANAAYVLNNLHLLFACETEARQFSFALSKFPAVVDSLGEETPRLSLLARKYLEAAGYCFRDTALIAFLEGYQESAALSTKEIWGLKAALELELLGRLTEAAGDEWPVLVSSLRRITEIVWKNLFEAISCAHAVLARDPAGAYSRMDFESRDRYQKVLASLASHSLLSEAQIAQVAIDLAEQARLTSDGSRSATRRTHIGYYLVDRGLPQLESAIGYRPPFGARIRRLVIRYPTAAYLTGIELLTLLIVFGILFKLDSVSPAYVGLLLLVLPATQAASDFINSLVTFLFSPCPLPKLDFSRGIPVDCATMVAVPTLLFSEEQVHDLALDLEIRFLANRDRNLYFALLTDLTDAESPRDPNDALVTLAVHLIEGLNQRYREEGRPRFFLFHRHHAYNEAEGRWMGWERKRGKLLDLNRLLRGSSDAFPVKVGDLSVLPQIRYVITLDADTQLPRDSAARLVGAMAHPLNQAVVDPATRVVVEGYGILQPRIGISVQSAARSRLAALYSGQTGFDIYTRAVSDVYQDLFGEGTFTGKGIYEVDVLRAVLEQRFPENALLSHDLIEGAYARAALVSDIELIDDYPSHFSAYSRRKHRWVRGDWQIMRWTQAQVPDFHWRLISNPINLISQWKILDNLRRSLVEPGLILLLLSGWLWLPGRPEYWTGAALLMWSIPVVSGLLFALLRAPRQWRALPNWLFESARALRENVLVALCSLIFLLHQALISMDAIVRAMARLFVTRKKMLEWETAAAAEAASRPKATVDIELEWTPYIALGLAVVIRFVRPEALPCAAPLLALWAISRPFSNWLNRPSRAGHADLCKKDVLLMRESADRIWRFFHDWSSPVTNWLIPDWVREDGTIELQLSPTNLGMLLNARVAALHMGALPLSEFVFETRETLERVMALPKYRGHLLNWYDINSLKPLRPQFVSSVDSGNLAAGLWTLKQAALALAAESPVKRGVTTELAAELRAISEVCDRLVREMDFSFLYQPNKEALSIGYHVAENRLEAACYDLLASEARMAVFVGIAKGDIPQECWFRLGRTHTLFRGERVLCSWSGTMFEYLMPSLWMRHYSDTILDHSMKAAVRSQREYGRLRGVPWGISESSFLSGRDGKYGYAAFGVPDLAMDRKETDALVISPYSTMLAAPFDSAAAVENLRQMQTFGWFGRYGFYEALDYSRTGGEAVRMWMAHHQGMSLLALVNLLFDNPIRQYFHAEPQVKATELLLHERMPTGALADNGSAMKAISFLARRLGTTARAAATPG